MEVRWQFFVEIWLITMAVLYVYRLIRGTRGANVLSGVVIFLASLLVIANVFQLKAIILLVQAVSAVLVIALVVIFQPELRQVLAELGRADFFAHYTRQSFVIENVVQAIEDLKEKCFGALIAFEQAVTNPQVLESGVPVRAVVTEELLTTIFTNKTPLHDGGVIIVDDQVQSAGCVFPLTQRQNLNRAFGLRHRAALGFSEESDAVVVVLSEETGDISICRKGEIERGLSVDELRQRLSEILLPKAKNNAQLLSSFVQRLGTIFQSGRPRKFTLFSVLELLVCFIIAVLIWFVIIQQTGDLAAYWPIELNS